MTEDEKLAEEYANTVKCEWENDTYYVDCRDKIEEAYLAGLKAARKEMWHDLRENPNDLPEDCVINQDGKRVLYDRINKVWRNDDADEYICDDPIVWCEIPTFGG